MLTEKELELFESKFSKVKNDCWEWEASLDATGYGRVYLWRISKLLNRSHAFKAHRVAKAHYHGEDLDSELFFCHKCDNRKCVNPDHIFLGTHQDNMNDMVAKGRSSGAPQSGDLNFNKRLNSKLVEEIRVKLKTMTNVAIGKEYGVHHSTISLIRKNKTWQS